MKKFEELDDLEGRDEKKAVKSSTFKVGNEIKKVRVNICRIKIFQVNLDFLKSSLFLHESKIDIIGLKVAILYE